MRNKINVMDRQPDITDEELERFKNFDTLLNKHYRILNDKKPGTWKIVVPVIVVVGSFVLYWLINEDSKPVEIRTSPSDSVVLLDNAKKEAVSELPEIGNEKKDSPKPVKSNRIKADTRTQQPVSATIADTVAKESEPVAGKDDPNPDAASPKTETVYIQAEPVDGYEALYAYFAKELIYPEAAVKDSVQGVMIVKFVINKEGRPEKIQTSGSLGVLFEKEAIRLIEHMPLWKPATVNGKPIASKLSIPLTFQLQKK